MSSSSNTAPVALGLIGAGLIGRRHAQMMASEPSCSLAGIADPSPAAESLAGELNVPWFASHAALLDCKDLAGVVIASPTHLHVPIALDCVRRRIPVLVEKPVAGSVSEGRTLATAAAAAGVDVAVGHHRRFSPAVGAARALLRDGAIGRLIAVSGIWSLRKPDAYFAEASWRSQSGGGPLLINLIHDVDLLRYCCGEVESVYAEINSAERGFAVEDSGAVTLRFASGALATVAFSDAAPSPWNWEGSAGDTPFVPPTLENCYRFLGSTGSLEFPQLAVWRHGEGREASWTEPLYKVPHEASVGDALRDQLRSFCLVARGESAPVCSAGDALASLAVLEAARESARVAKSVAPAAI